MATSFHPKPEPASPAGPPPGDPGAAGRSKPARWTPYLAGLLFAAAFAWASGLLDKGASLGIRFFELYAQSQLAMLQAADNVVNGRAEYAVLIEEGTNLAMLKAEIDPMSTMQYERESAVPGWIVISVADGDRDAVSVLKSSDFARLVVPNRGLWICH